MSCDYEETDTRCITQGRVGTSVRKDEQLCFVFIGNLFRYLCQKLSK